MSWSLSKMRITKNDLDELLAEVKAIAEKTNPNGVDQVEIAVNIVETIIDSLVVGDPTKQFNVQINGHGNSNHEPQSGWANDYIAVNVSQA